MKPKTTCKSCRKLTKTLRGLSDSVLFFIHHLDEEMRKQSTVERGRKIAKMCNWLDSQNDTVRIFSLGLDSLSGDKAKAVAKLLKKK